MWLRILGLGYGGEENIVDLSQLRSSYVAQDGDVLTGEYKVNGRISVADGTTVTLSNCKILNNQTVVDRHPAIVCKGSATLILKGDNELKGGAGDYPAIYIQQGYTLTIGGYGTLLASVHGMAAAIGSGNASDSKNSGNIVIKSGHINAYGSVQSAAIGMGAQMNSESYCGPIIISNKIKTLEVYNPGASGTNLRTVIFGDRIEYGDTKQALTFMLYLLVHLEKAYDEVKDNTHYEIFKDGKRFRITPLQ